MLPNFSQKFSGFFIPAYPFKEPLFEWAAKLRRVFVPAIFFEDYYFSGLKRTVFCEYKDTVYFDTQSRFYKIFQGFCRMC